MLFWTSTLASTIPIPSGLFIPVLKMGAAYGRLLGELMAAAYPNGINYGDYSHPASIVPGSYAVVGAAAFSGAVTHTISTSVILFEMTGQIVHIIPVILGVLISNAVCQSLQPSIYDSIIEIKKLPYLPPIASSNSISHKILVRDFMNTNLPYVWKDKFTYAHLKELLTAHKKIISFPLVESAHSMKLLGTVARPDLLKLLYVHLGRERRLQEVCRRNSDTLSPAIHLLSTISGKLAADEHDRRLERELAGKRHNHHQQAGRGERQKGNKCGAPLGGIQFSARRGAEEPPNKGLTEFKPNRRSSAASSTSSESSSSASSAPTTDSLASSGSLSETKQHRKGSVKMLQIVDRANNPNGDDDDQTFVCDASRLIVEASRPPNYAATGTTDKSSPSSAGKGPLERLEENKLLSECHCESSSDSDNEQRLKQVARMVNHYDRGTSMDEEELERSIKKVERQLAEANKMRPEIVVLIEKGPAGSESGVTEQPPKASELDRANKSYELPQQQQQCQPHEPAKTRLMSHRNDSFRSLRPYQSSLFRLKQTSSSNYVPSSPSLSSRPTKSILKTSSVNSMSKRNMSAQSFHNSYSLAMSSVEGLASRPNDSKAGRGRLIGHFTIDDSSQEPTPVRQRRKVRLPRLRVVDMTPEEQEQWEKEQLNAYVDISNCQIDEAPFQLVEQTSLYRVHTLFSMLGLNHAYVTSFGRLVGIVALKDIRYAVEKMLQD